MGFRELEIKREYRNQEKNIVKNFFMPLMSTSVLYQRAVGFFSSTALDCYSKGITRLVKNGGRMELVASPKLSEKDMEAMRLGYELRDDIIQRALINALSNPVNQFAEDRLNLLATLIADEKLEVKIAFVDNGNSIGIYHEKLGLLYDEAGDVVSFSGSMNESENGFTGNYETVDVYRSWIEPKRVEDKVTAFQKIWNHEEQGIVIKRFPKIEEEIINRYKRETVNVKVDEEEFDIDFDIDKYKINNLKNQITMSEDTLYEYQRKAINIWKQNCYRGIFDMCTGAGKTYTAIGAIKCLFDELEGHLAVVIVVPYQHLVEQWVEDLVNFNIQPIVGYGIAKYRGYKKKLKSKVFDYNIGILPFLCFICTNASFKDESVQRYIGKIRENKLLIVDEAHNFGASTLQKTMKPDYQYRLALSATLERHGDSEGTGILYDFFGDKCIEYTLQEAIEDQKLTEYYYYPQVVCLSADELSRYEELSKEMQQYMHMDKSGKWVMSEQAKRIAIKRSRIVAGAIEKVQKLKKAMEPYQDKHYLLVYCGAATLREEDYQGEDIEEDIRQIDLITKVLGEELNMNVAQFTSRENAEERANLIDRFKQGEELQGLVAIKCLDEGVNIPAIRTAFILASTTNPKEYIQRRGRVLRRAQGKTMAEIYDFITLPRPLDMARNMSLEEIRMDKSLVRNELNRMEEFKTDSLNPYDSNSLMEEMRDAYGLEQEDEGVADVYETI